MMPCTRSRRFNSRSTGSHAVRSEQVTPPPFNALPANARQRWSTLLLLCGALLGSAANADVASATGAEPAGTALLVDRFDSDLQNRLGGYFNTYERAPSSATALRVDSVRRGVAGRSLKISADRRREGFCGVWLHFFDFKQEQPTYLDARPYRYLSFWVRGVQGGESFVVKMADRRWLEKEDALEIGSVLDWLPQGVTQQWQEVHIPLANAAKLNLSELANWTIEFTGPGKSTIFIDDVALLRTGESMQVAAREGPDEPLRPQLPRSMWVWTMPQQLQDPARVDKLLAFCQRHQIGQLWTQVDYHLDRSSSPIRCTLKQAPEWRRFLREAERHGVQVHALDGSPEFALSANHEISLALVDCILRWNRAAPAAERFAGVHLDNEPYLLLGWQDKTLREQILEQYLELNAACQRRIDEEPSLVFGVDIPFWWQTTDPVTGLPQAEVTFQGKRQAASFHCLDLLDNVGVMNYRDRADGVDGMISHGRELLEYATERQHAEIYMGVETIAPQVMRAGFLPGLTHDQFAARIRSHTLLNRSRWDQRRLLVLRGPRRTHIGLEFQEDPQEVLRSAAWQKLHERLRCSQLDTNEALQDAREAMRTDAEWSGYMVLPNSQPSTFVGQRTMLGKVTFAEETAAHFEEHLRAAEDAFARCPRYAGVALHHYESVQRLLEDPAQAHADSSP